MMDTRRLLEQLLNAGREMAGQSEGYARQAEDYAARKLGVEGDEKSRADMRKGAAGGALAAGALALLLGARTGRALGGTALKIGTLAGLGALAYNAYRRYKGEDPQQEGQSIQRLDGPPSEIRARALMAAMISAAKADGHIDDREREIIETRMKGLDGVDFAFIRTALAAPCDPDAVASLSDGPQAAREIYLISAYVMDQADPHERRYLDDLATALDLDIGLVRALEEETRGEA